VTHVATPSTQASHNVSPPRLQTSVEAPRCPTTGGGGGGGGGGDGGDDCASQKRVWSVSNSIVNTTFRHHEDRWRPFDQRTRLW
jgi:hypothetical protein